MRNRSLRVLGFVASSAIVILVPACESGARESTADGGGVRLDGARPRIDAFIAFCDPAQDQDGDGLADALEGMGDADRDGTPNRLDADSDNDGVVDRDEAGRNPCVALDSDQDGRQDSQDIDSDNDGLTDGREDALGTRRVDVDTDRDGFTDLVEVAAGTDPINSASRIAPEDYFVVLPYEGETQTGTLRFDTHIVIADVYFLLDTTRSMDPEVVQIQTGLQRVIIPGIQSLIRDVEFGAGGFDDFPVEPHGEMTDLPFYHLIDIVPLEQDQGTVQGAFAAGSDAPTFVSGAPNSSPDILDAIAAYPRHFGRNFNESGAEALYQVATGEGIAWQGNRRSIPPRECPEYLDEFVPRVGYPCFRPGALPVIIYVSDACLHQPLPDSFPPDRVAFDQPSLTYHGFDPAPHTYAQALEQLRAIGARVLTLSTDSVPSASDYPATAHLCNIARDTGAVRSDGTPLCFEAGPDGTNITREIVDAVGELVADTPQDVRCEAVDVRGNPEDFDGSRFVTRIEAVIGYRDQMSGQGYSSRHDAIFEGVIPGTQVEFAVEFHNAVRPQRETAEVFQATLRVVGNGSALLDSRRVFIVVPPLDYDVILY